MVEFEAGGICIYRDGRWSHSVKETTTKTPKQSMNGRKRQDADGNQKFIRLVWLVVPRIFLDKHSLIKPSNLKSLIVYNPLSIIWLRYVHRDLENEG